MIRLTEQQFLDWGACEVPEYIKAEYPHGVTLSLTSIGMLAQDDCKVLTNHLVWVCHALARAYDEPEPYFADEAFKDCKIGYGACICKIHERYLALKWLRDFELRHREASDG